MTRAALRLQMDTSHLAYLNHTPISIFVRHWQMHPAAKSANLEIDVSHRDTYPVGAPHTYWRTPTIMRASMND